MKGRRLSYYEGFALVLPGFIAFAPECCGTGRRVGRPDIPASESVLESLPSVALSPAQVTAF